MSEFPEINFISIVAFTTNSDLKVTSKSDVIYTVKLKKTISRYNNETVSDSERDQIYNKLRSLNIDSKKKRKTHIQAIHKDIEETKNKINNHVCPKCGGQLVERTGRYGKFRGCINFPKCRYVAK